MKGAREKAARGTRMEEFLLPFPVSLAVQLLYTRAFRFSTPERPGFLHQSLCCWSTDEVSWNVSLIPNLAQLNSILLSSWTFSHSFPLEVGRFELPAFHMQSERSTNWAIPPLCHVKDQHRAAILAESEHIGRISLEAPSLSEGSSDPPSPALQPQL